MGFCLAGPSKSAPCTICTNKWLFHEAADILMCWYVIWHYWEGSDALLELKLDLPKSTPRNLLLVTSFNFHSMFCSIFWGIWNSSWALEEEKISGLRAGTWITRCDCSSAKPPWENIPWVVECWWFMAWLHFAMVISGKKCLLKIHILSHSPGRARFSCKIGRPLFHGRIMKINNTYKVF